MASTARYLDTEICRSLELSVSKCDEHAFADYVHQLNIFNKTFRARRQRTNSHKMLNTHYRERNMKTNYVTAAVTTGQ